ncbi:PREDICTED: uncharacterized protein LOC104588257 [Nelumbo nucifera]|uniref:Uncharacterized protein LOC104588257 n=1 Tax=Nelumbo nucifera TaxID=4432 RepID=A0A1U8PYL8_NELNU|nr:PREDICTED: uncharacterized protein LOC104588257 [Nelumbo nucifera]
MGKRFWTKNGLGYNDKVILLAMVFMILMDGVVDGESLIKQKLLEVNKRLKLLNRPAVKSIQSEDGEIIDCIDLFKQPAFDHPMLKNHTIQMKPTYDPPTMRTTKQESSTKLVSQVWRRSGSCPQGTIPIRRIRKINILKANSLEDYGRKRSPASSRASSSTRTMRGASQTNHFNQKANQSVAILLTEGYNYIGAKGDINVWNPYVESDDEYTTAQICIKDGPYYDFESIESGWTVNPGVYGDRRTRFFSYWTKTGCFDLLCPGFVQTSNEIALGSAIEPISVTAGPQYHIALTIFKDPYTRNWWLQMGNDIKIGYWPPDIFSGLSHIASSVEWGGQVYSTNVRKIPHTSTAMGSGEFPAFMYGSACYIGHIRILDYSLTWKYPSWVYPLADEYNCYNAFSWIEDTEPTLYFGGPGRSFKCP